MYWFVVWYYRLFDFLLKKPVDLGNRADVSDGQWNQTVGALGEKLACRWLWKSGRKVLYQNYRAHGGGEIDIVLRDKDVLVFCEVKTRTSRDFGRPADAVDREKRTLITRGANGWLQELGYLPALFRFDIVEVLLIEGERPEVNHIQNAFQSAPHLLT